MKTQHQITVAIADDHPVYRLGLIKLLSSKPEFKIIHEAQNGLELIKKIDSTEHVPDIILLDIRMPVMNGYETLKKIMKYRLQTKVLVLSMIENEYTIIRMLLNGAAGYISKDDSTDKLTNAIKYIHQNGRYYSPEIIELISNRGANIDELVPSLTDREIEFLKLCCEDMTYHEMAQKMNIAKRSIENYRESLFKKLRVKHRVALAVFAMQTGLASAKYSSY